MSDPSGSPMTGEAVLGRIASQRVVPVVTVDDPVSASGLVGALADGGLSVIEITLRTSAGLEAIRRVAAEQPGVVVGAGSVKSGSSVEDALDAGARFIVSPGLDRDVVVTAADRGVLIIPGIATATELLAADALGVEVVKVFPASVVGGPGLIRALAAVWPDMRFMPTGGVTAEDANDYLALPGVVAVGGSWMVDPAAAAAGEWDRVRDAAAVTVGGVR